MVTNCPSMQLKSFALIAFVTTHCDVNMSARIVDWNKDGQQRRFSFLTFLWKQ